MRVQTQILRLLRRDPQGWAYTPGSAEHECTGIKLHLSGRLCEVTATCPDVGAPWLSCMASLRIRRAIARNQAVLLANRIRNNCSR